MTKIDPGLLATVKAQLVKRRIWLEEQHLAADARGSFFPPQFLDQLIWAIRQLDLGRTALAVRELYYDLKKAPSTERGEIRQLLEALPQEWRVAPRNDLALYADGGLHNEEEAKLFAAALLRKQSHPPRGHLFIIGPDGESQEFSIAG